MGSKHLQLDFESPTFRDWMENKENPIKETEEGAARKIRKRNRRMIRRTDHRVQRN